MFLWFFFSIDDVYVYFYGSRPENCACTLIWAQDDLVDSYKQKIFTPNGSQTAISSVADANVSLITVVDTVTLRLH